MNEALTIRRLHTGDFDQIVDFRCGFVADIKPAMTADERKELERQTREWVKKTIDSRSLVCYGGFAGSRPACCASLLLYELPPLYGCKKRTIGHVLNFFTLPEFRKRGFGKSLMEYIKEDAQDLGLYRLSLNATAMGEPLYRTAGFVEQAEKALIYTLSD